MKDEHQIETFGQRYYENARRQALAPAIGSLAITAESDSNLDARQLDELASGLAEALPGVVKTEWTYKSENGKLIAKDGQEIEQLLINGFRQSVAMAAKDNFYEPFLPQRARHELDEIREQEAMVNGRTDFNTIVTFSPYSQEYDSPETRAKLKIAAQEPDWQRGMIRVSHAVDGELHIFTRSMDGSSVELFKAIARRQLGYNFVAEDSTEMLGERIYIQTADNLWPELADSLVETGDSILSQHSSSDLVQGRATTEALDTQKYVNSQRPIIEALIDLSKELALQHKDYGSYKQALEAELYNHIALLKLGIGTGANQPIINMSAASSAAGAIAAARGEVYNMCGYMLSGSDATAETAAKTGFESLLRLAGKPVECPACKQKVIVPSSKLREGRLCCLSCDYEVDACTGQVHKKTTYKQATAKKAASKTAESDWQRIVREDAAKRAKLKQELANPIRRFG